MEKEINVNGKTFKVRELLATELDQAVEITDKKESLKRQVIISTGIDESAYSALTVKERFEIVKTMNEVNGLSGFQKSSI